MSRVTKNSIKAIIMDGDGSTLTSTLQLPENLRNLMLENKQFKWIMATGRSLDLLKHTPIIEYLSQDVPHVLDGGSRIMYLDGRSESEYFISDEELELLFKILQLEKVKWIYYSPDGFHGYGFSLELKFRVEYIVHPKIQITEDIEKFKLWVKVYRPTKIFIHIKENIELNGLYWHQNDNNIDVTARGVNKGSAVFELTQKLGFTPSEIIFIFNDKNDLPVVLHPELQGITKIKVGNYLPNLQADFNVATPFDVGEVLTELLLAR